MSKFFLKKPIEFNLQVAVSTVFMEHKGRLLLLRRSQCEISPNSWGVPGGKLEKNETPLEGLLREIQEELSLSPDTSELEFLRSLYVRHPKMDYALHLFRWILSAQPLIRLNPHEHSEYLWQPTTQLKELPLLEGQFEAFQYAYTEIT